MKTLKLALLIATVVFASCSDKEDDPVPAAPIGPDLAYAETKFETTFHSTGNTGLPTLKWNGEIGNLSLSTSTPGVYINSANGTVSWTKSLPLGTNMITAVAINSTGQKAVTIEIANEFQGELIGAYNGNPDSEDLPEDGFAINFEADGSVVVDNYGWDTAIGTWARDENTITAVYSYDGGSSFYTVSAELIYNNQKASLKGYWYSGDQVLEANKEGYIVINLN